MKFQTRHEQALVMLDECGALLAHVGARGTMKWAVAGHFVRLCGLATNALCWRFDRQFQYLREQRETFLAAGDWVLSVDTKKKELIGELKNASRTYRRTAYEVNAHDFPHDAVCKAVPLRRACTT